MAKRRASRAPNDERKERLLAHLPDIVIEILSDTDSENNPIEKVELYARNGAGFVVAIDPFENIVETRGEPASGFELDIQAIIEA